MEAASSTSLTEFIHHRFSRMDQQQESIFNTAHAVQVLVAQVSELTQHIQQLTIPVVPPAPSVPRAAPQSSHLGRSPAYPFLRVMPLSRTSVEHSLPDVPCISHCSFAPLRWRSLRWPSYSHCSCECIAFCALFHTFAAKTKRVFDRVVAGKEAARRLMDLKQGDFSVTDNSIEFRTLVAECKWNEEVQWDMFLYWLADRVQGEIYMLELPQSLNGLIGPGSSGGCPH